jgi:hypothetical protein
VDEDLKRRLRESVAKWERRPRHADVTPGVLAATPDDLVEQAMVDFVLDHGVWRATELLKLLAALPEGYGVVYTTWILDAEVANGGFHQYFWNTDGHFVDLVTRGVERLHSEEHQRALDEAVRLFRAEGKPDVSGLEAQEQLALFSKTAMESPWASLDARWYELPELSLARIRFIRAHADLFTARLPWLPRWKLAASAAFRRFRG